MDDNIWTAGRLDLRKISQLNKQKFHNERNNERLLINMNIYYLSVVSL